MLLNIVFWFMVAVDAAVLALIFVLGLAAAKPSHTSLFSVATFMLLPAVILLVCIVVFVRANSTGWRIAAVILAASPTLLAAGGRAWAEWEVRGLLKQDGTWYAYQAGPLRELEIAIANNDVIAATNAAKRASLNKAGMGETTPLLLAIRQLEKTPAQLEILSMLLDAGADPNSSDGGDLPLVAAIYVSREAGIEPVRMLLKAGARPNQLDRWGTPAFFAASAFDVEILRLLLDSGADLNLTRSGGMGPLLDAINTNNWKVVLLMLERGADWRKFKTANGQNLLERLESEARGQGASEGLAEVIHFVKARASQ